jgi:hypothetical protein
LDSGTPTTPSLQYSFTPFSLTDNFSFNRGSHAAHHVAIDTDAQRLFLGIAFVGCQRDVELARQLGRKLGEQAGSSKPVVALICISRIILIVARDYA